MAKKEVQNNGFKFLSEGIMHYQKPFDERFYLEEDIFFEYKGKKFSLTPFSHDFATVPWFV